LGKTTFHLVALGAAGKVLLKKKFTQRQLLTYTAKDADFAGRLGSLFRSALSRTGIAEAGPRGAADRSPIREAL